MMYDVGVAAHCEFFVPFWLTHPHLCSRSWLPWKLCQSFGGKSFHDKSRFHSMSAMAVIGILSQWGSIFMGKRPYTKNSPFFQLAAL